MRDESRKWTRPGVSNTHPKTSWYKRRYNRIVKVKHPVQTSNKRRIIRYGREPAASEREKAVRDESRKWTAKLDASLALATCIGLLRVYYELSWFSMGLL